MHYEDSKLPELLALDLDTYFKQLALQYQDVLYTFALRLTGRAQDAEDIVQEALLGAYLTLAHYPVERIRTLNLRGWLYKLTLNVFRNSKRGSRLLIMPLDLDDESQALAMQDAEEERPEVLFEGAERLRELAALVGNLPEHYRLVVTCYYFEELTYPEIAELLDQPLGTVKSRMHRAVRMLRQRMQQQERNSTYGAL